MKTAKKQILMVGAVVVLVAIGVGGFLAAQAEIKAERERDMPVKPPTFVSRGADGQSVIKLDAETQQRVGLVTRALAAQSMRPEIVAYGTLQDDPSQSFMLRAPLPGTLRLSKEHNWPKLGDVLPDGAVIGAIELRLSPTDRVDLASKLAGAKADVEANAAVLEQDRLAYERLKTLNSEEKSVSDRALQEALAKLKGDEARAKAARETAAAIESASSAASGALGSLPLALSRGGEVAEVQANINENVESGQPIIRVARFDTMMATVSVPVGEHIDTKGATVSVLAVGHEDHPVAAELAGLAPAVDPKTLGQSLLLRIKENSIGLRPGAAVMARVQGAEKQGVVVPREAVVYFDGKPWVYLQTDKDTFVRRPVATDSARDGGFFVTSGMSGGQRIVTTGAQTLLSEELKSNIQISS
jgi:RND family efflux transporter MFP subunit